MPFQPLKLPGFRKLGLALFMLLGGCQAGLNPFARPVLRAADRPLHTLLQSLQTQCWITYTPSTFDPTVTPMYWPTQAEVEADLRTLRTFGVKGLVTYRANYNDRDHPSTLLNLPDLAQQAGFEGIILGIWDLESAAEQAAVQVFQEHPFVLGFVAGNEGLEQRYTWDTLVTTIATLQVQTQKPVTTSEELRDYFVNDRLRQAGDWIFPNAHPYFGKVKDPRAAAQWTENWFDRLGRITDRPIVFKEVGLPTAGDPEVSEEAQAQYYQALRQTPVHFVFFTAFDLPWKRSTGQASLSPHLNPEPYWGLFQNDRTPKAGAKQLQSEQCSSGFSQ